MSADQVVPAPEEQLRHVTGYPPGSWLNLVSMSPDGRYIAFTVRSPGGPGDPPRKPLELWVADAETGAARVLLRSPELGLNTVFEDYSWADDETIVAAVLPEGAGPPPSRAAFLAAPKVFDNSGGRKSQNRTWTDLLKDEHDVALFEHYGTSRLVSVHVPSGRVSPLGPPRLYVDVDPSPDGRFLLVSWLERPFSFAVPCGRFPKRTQLWDKQGGLLREVCYLPLAEDIPIAFNACRKGPRAVGWRDDKPAELSWIEARDGGDPAVEVSPRDVVYTLPVGDAYDGRATTTVAAGAAATGGAVADASASNGHSSSSGAAAAAAPSSSSSAAAEAAAAAARVAALPPSVLATTDLRCGGVAWCDGDLALLYESWWKTRRSVIWTLSPDRPQDGKKVLFDRNYEDTYADPGSPLSRRTKLGTYVLAKVDGARKLLMSGTGASPEGNRPFLDLLDIDTGATSRLWQSAPPYYEQLGSIMSDVDGESPIKLDGLQMLLTRETARDPPQSYLKTFGAGGAPASERQVTAYPHPYPHLVDMQREVIRYPRADGVMLTATLYLPPGYDKERDGPLPCIFWA